MINIILDSQWLSSLMSCPRMGHYRFNLCLEKTGGKPNSFECGSLAHTILEHYNKALIKGSSRADAIAAGFAAGEEYRIGYKESNIFITDPNERGLQNTPEESDRNHTGWKHVIKTMHEYFDHYRNDQPTILGAEEVREAIIYQDEEMRVKWRAKFDCILEYSHGIYPKDYKTSRQRRDILELNNQFLGQCFLLGCRNIIIDRIGFQTSLKTDEKFSRETISYSSDLIAEWAKEIVPHYARMWAAYTEAEYFPPNFTHCENKYGRCRYYEIDKSDRNMREQVMKLEYTKGKVWDITND